MTAQIAAKYSRRMSGLVEVLQKAGFAAAKPKGSFFLYVKAPTALVDRGARRAFTSAEEVSQWLIADKLISTVPWDDAGAYLRFSVTFAARDPAEERRALEEIGSRLGGVTFEF
jgi:LL-diaminopimelate aminotransferase